MAEYDAIVIGGGVNGAGVARDFALRGLRVALCEKRDIGSGTSGHSSSMIHGGPRYLATERHVTRASAADAGAIRRIAKHLVFRIPFLLPLYRRMPRLYVEALEAYWESYDAFQPLKGSYAHTRLGRAEALRVEPGLGDDVVGAVTFDEWGIDGTRLCLGNALDARERGATVLAHREVVGFVRDGARVAGVVLDGGEKLEGRVVCNLAGPWAPGVAELAGVRVRIRPGKGIHLVYARRVSDYGIMALAIDRRWIFLEPHHNGALLGTTDDDFYGNPDELRATEDEVGYLLEGMASAFPRVREHRFVRAIAGVRPTLYSYGRLEDRLSRDHRILDHEKDGAPGLWTMVGGKLAAYRMMAEEFCDVVMMKIGRAAPCRTHETPLPGGRDLPNAQTLADAFRVPPIAATRLVTRQGGRAARLLEGGDDAGRTPVCPCEPVLACEVAHAVREEGATSIDDIRRRTRLSEGACQGTVCLGHAAACLHAAGAGVARAHASLRESLDERFRGRVAALDWGGANLAQEELLQGRYFLVGSLQRSQLSEIDTDLGPNGHGNGASAGRIRGHSLPEAAGSPSVASVGVTP